MRLGRRTGGLQIVDEGEDTCVSSSALLLRHWFLSLGRSRVVKERLERLVAVWAHADDEGPVTPILARYAREGVQVYMIIATDGAQGAANTSHSPTPI